MNLTRRSSTPAPLFLLCLLLPACHAYHPVRIQVLDAQTHQPIPRATVHDCYMTDLNATDVYLDLLFGYTNDPKSTSATTDPNGLAVLQISDRRARTRGATARADGYLPSKAYLDSARFDQIRREHRRTREFPTAGPPDLTLELRLDPNPTPCPRSPGAAPDHLAQ